MNKLTKWIIAISSIVILGIIAFVAHKDLTTEIILNGPELIEVEHGETYEDQGASVMYLDKEVALLTSNDVNTNSLKEEVLTYEYKWLFKTHTAMRTVKIIDTKAPSLTLKGKEKIELTLGDNFVEPGFEALDNVDGDLTKKVSVESNLDLDAVGEYTLSYLVEDTSGNTTSHKRVVNIVAPPEPEPTTVNPTTSQKGVIYLTFDDGSHATRTDAVLDILKREDIKATFFVTGKGPDAPIKRIYNEGHTIGLHTYTHDYAKLYASVEAYYDDLNKVSDYVENITGHKSMLIRFPGGTSNTISRNYSPGIMSTLVKDVTNKGYVYHDWNVDSMDASGNVGSQKVISSTIEGLSKNRPNIVLMHDIHQHTVDALPAIIQYGKNNGYTFKAITMETKPVQHGVHN